jgi:hypothetical protein
MSVACLQALPDVNTKAGAPLLFISKETRPIEVQLRVFTCFV